MIDLNELLTFVFSLAQTAALTAIGILVPFAVKWILQRTKLDGVVEDEAIRNYLETALVNSVVFAIDQARARYGGDVAVVTVKNEVLKFAVDYVLKSVPDAVAHFEITEARLKELITVRLNKVLGV